MKMSVADIRGRRDLKQQLCRVWLVNLLIVGHRLKDVYFFFEAKPANLP
jgi:hypothetical protein